MFSHCRTISRTIFILIALVMLFLPVAPLVKAQGTDHAEGSKLNWRIEGHFSDDTLHVQWIMSEIAEPYKMKDIVKLDISERCQIIGDVQIYHHTANFNKGYIECEIPNFPKMAEQYGAAAEGSSCQIESIATNTLFAAVEFSMPSWGASDQPIMAYDKMMVSASSGNPNPKLFQTYLLLDQEIFSSNQAPFSDESLTSTYLGFNTVFLSQILNSFSQGVATPYQWLYSKELYYAAQNSANDSVIGWLEWAPATITPFNFKYQLDASAEKFFIGYNPSTGEIADGLILSQFIGDPGCGNKMGK